MLLVYARVYDPNDYNGNLNTGTPVATQVVPQAAAIPANNAELFNFQSFATNVRNNLGSIIRVMPDLFR